MTLLRNTQNQKNTP